MTTTIQTGTQAWTVAEVEGRDYYSTTVGGLTYTVCYHEDEGRWVGQSGHRRIFADTLEQMAAKRKALRTLPAAVETANAAA